MTSAFGKEKVLKTSSSSHCHSRSTWSLQFSQRLQQHVYNNGFISLLGIFKLTFCWPRVSRKQVWLGLPTWNQLLSLCLQLALLCQIPMELVKQLQRTNQSWAVIRNRNKQWTIRLSGRLLRFTVKIQTKSKTQFWYIITTRAPPPPPKKNNCSFWKKSNNRP